ncbi:MAG: hypothetical protein ACXWPM_11370 [Bdellovibrionota bacterium]
MPPRWLIFTMLIEVILVVSTAILLTQPRFLLHPQSERTKSLATYSGFLFLCLTFCWSVISGSVLAIFHMGQQ